MSRIPARVAHRLTSALKRFQPILASARARDVNESDTVILVTDLLAELFGYDKYTEITSECAIRGTWCDLGIKQDGKFLLLIEVKAIGSELKEPQTKQAVDYAANQGVDWVVLTNAETWRVYRLTFGKPVTSELVLEFNISQLQPRREADLEILYHLTREGWAKSAIDDFHMQRQALNRYVIAATIQSPPVLDALRRELRRLSPDVRVSKDEIQAVLLNEVLKREVVEGDKAVEAARKLQRAATRALRARTSRQETAEVASAEPVAAE